MASVFETILVDIEARLQALPGFEEVVREPDYDPHEMEWAPTQLPRIHFYDGDPEKVIDRPIAGLDDYLWTIPIEIIMAAGATASDLSNAGTAVGKAVTAAPALLGNKAQRLSVRKELQPDVERRPGTNAIRSRDLEVFAEVWTREDDPETPYP